MSTNSAIEWTESTWNPVTGCTKISAGCTNCYAERMARRLKAMGQKNYTNGFKVALHPHALFLPLKWKKNFKAFFTAAEGWGSLEQKRHATGQTNRFDLKWGKLKAKTLVLEVPKDVRTVKPRVMAGQKQVEATGKTAMRPLPKSRTAMIGGAVLKVPGVNG